MTFNDKTIGDIASVQTGPFGSQLHNEDYVLVGTPIVTVEHLGERKMTRQNLPCVSDADKNRLSKYTLKYGDLVFSRVGSVDRCSLVSEDEDGWMFSGRCLRVRPNNPEEIYHRYLYYFFNLEATKEFVRNIAVGATMPSINTRLLAEVPISFPSIEEQRNIGDTLSALDDRIEANRKANHHLLPLMSATDSSPDIRRGKRASRISARRSDSMIFASHRSINDPANSSNFWRVSLLGKRTGTFFKSVCVINGCVEPRFIL